MEITNDQLVMLASTIADKVAHLKSSPETKKMFDDIDKKVDKLSNSLDLHINDFKHFSDEMARRMDEHQKVQDATLIELKSNLEKKAGKWVENALRWVSFLVIGAVIFAMLDTVLRK